MPPKGVGFPDPLSETLNATGNFFAARLRTIARASPLRRLRDPKEMRVVNSYAQVPHPNRGDDRGSRLTDYEVLVGAAILFNNQHVQSRLYRARIRWHIRRRPCLAPAFEAVSLTGASRK